MSQLENHKIEFLLLLFLSNKGYTLRQPQRIIEELQSRMMNIQDSFVTNIRKSFRTGIQWDNDAFLLLSDPMAYKGVKYNYTVEDNIYIMNILVSL